MGMGSGGFSVLVMEILEIKVRYQQYQSLSGEG